MQTPINQINDALTANYTAEAQEGYDNLMNMTAIIMEKTAPLRARKFLKMRDASLRVISFPIQRQINQSVKKF